MELSSPKIKKFQEETFLARKIKNIGAPRQKKAKVSERKLVFYNY